MAKYLKMILLLGVIIAFSSVVYAQDLVVFEPVPNLDLGPNVDADEPLSDGSTYYFKMGPGASYSTTSALYADFPGDYDRYVMTVVSQCTVRIEVVDCCIMGDTICLGKSATIKKCATSPATVVYIKTFEPGTYQGGVAYTVCPGGYPAGYTFYADGSQLDNHNYEEPFSFSPTKQI